MEGILNNKLVREGSTTFCINKVTLTGNYNVET